MTAMHSLSFPARKSTSLAYVPVVLLPAATWVLFAGAAPWALMWLLALTLFAGLKWLTLADYLSQHRAGVGRLIAYACLWPGMDPWAFCACDRHVDRPAIGQWLISLANACFGLLLFFAVAGPLLASRPTLAAWVGMVGIIFALHFGMLQLISLAWLAAGVDAQPIMRAPILSKSLSEFWSRRWNLAFRDLSHRYLLRPLAKQSSIAFATLVVFFVSGIIHDLVITIPAGGGYGLPTLYFTLQGVGVLLERSRWGKRIGLGQGIVGRAFVLVMTVALLPLAFPPAFVEHVIVPMLQFIA